MPAGETSRRPLGPCLAGMRSLHDAPSPTTSSRWPFEHVGRIAERPLVRPWTACGWSGSACRQHRQQQRCGHTIWQRMLHAARKPSCLSDTENQIELSLRLQQTRPDVDYEPLKLSQSHAHVHQAVHILTEMPLQAADTLSTQLWSTQTI